MITTRGDQMKVKELIDLLQNQDPEALIVMSKDSEGNAFRTFSDLCPGQYVAEGTWYGDFQSQENIDNSDDLDCYELYGEKGVKSVCLWPTN